MDTLLFSSFMMNSLLAGVGIAIPAAVIGCFLIWRRMAFFGDALGHTAILGVALGAVLQLNIYVFIIIICLSVALILGVISKRSPLPADIWLSILAYGALALGILIMAKATWLRLDPEAVLFGDILAIDQMDLLSIFTAALLLMSILRRYWRPLIQLTIDEDLAATAGINVGLYKVAFLFVMAIVTAVGLKTVGALMLPGLMIIPAVTASCYSRTPEQMVFYAIAIAVSCVIVGIIQSFYLDLLTGPSIVLTAVGLLVLSKVIKTFKN